MTRDHVGRTLGVAAVVALALSACGGGHTTATAPPLAATTAASPVTTSPPASTTAPVPASPTSTAPMAPTAVPSTAEPTATARSQSPAPSTGTSGSPAGTGKCTTVSLAITDDGEEPASAMYLGEITVRDLAAPCTLYGYPGVDVYRSDGHKEPAVATRVGTPKTVTLTKGQKAYASYDISFDSSKTCKTDAYALVTPPDETASVRVTAAPDGLEEVGAHCSTSFDLMPFALTASTP